MRRYTTPFQELYIPGIDLTGADIYVTYADLHGNVIITKTDVQAEYDDTGTSISVRLTQEQSILFKANQEYQVQVNWMTGNDRAATCIAHFKVVDNLLKEILT